jgi:hypothetical protein
MKTVMKSLIVLFLLLILEEIAFAIGVVPGRTTINFEPGISQEVIVRVLNNQKKDMNVLVSKEGELSDYVVLGSEGMSFNSNEGEKFFTYTVNLPQEIEKPGDHDVEISFVEVPDSATEGETMIGARPSVVTQLRVKVPYPGRYAEADLQISVLDDDVTFTIPLFNLGTEDLNIRANIRILGPDDEELAEINTDSIEVRAGGSSKIVGHWSAPFVGNYLAVVEVDYGKVIELEKGFDVGDMFIRIVDIMFGEFELGDIARIDIEVQSGWNEIIEGVYADVFIKNKEGHTIAILKTASYDIKALSDGLLTAFWDTKEVIVGTYEVVIKLNYAGKWSEERFEIIMGEEYIRKVIEIAKPRILIWLLIIVALIISIIIVFYIYFKRKTE